jgi:hypothetical protein
MKKLATLLLLATLSVTSVDAFSASLSASASESVVMKRKKKKVRHAYQRVARRHWLTYRSN